jgi:hypothetical protein
MVGLAVSVAVVDLVVVAPVAADGPEVASAPARMATALSHRHSVPDP